MCGAAVSAALASARSTCYKFNGRIESCKEAPKLKTLGVRTSQAVDAQIYRCGSKTIPGRFEHDLNVQRVVVSDITVLNIRLFM
jgi:hypothetical protein